MAGARLVAAAAALVLLAGCGGDDAPVAAPTPSPSEDSFIRGRDLPGGAVLENQTLSAHTHRRMARGVADLKTLGLWDDLTDHLFVVRVTTREGLGSAPADGHLAQALLQRRYTEEGAGELCYIVFFTDAIARDLPLLAGGVDRIDAGFIRRYWSSILAHELAHCLDGGSGEDVAREWERRVFDELSGL